MAESSENSNHSLYQPKWFLLSFYSSQSCPLSEYTIKLFNLAGFLVQVQQFSRVRVFRGLILAFKYQLFQRLSHLGPDINPAKCVTLMWISWAELCMPSMLTALRAVLTAICNFPIPSNKNPFLLLCPFILKLLPSLRPGPTVRRTYTIT